MPLEIKQGVFDQLVSEWAAADRECQRTHDLWQAACRRRMVLAAAKNAAWDELEISRKEAMNAIEHS